MEKDLLNQELDKNAVKTCLDTIKLVTTWQVNPSPAEELKEGQAILAYSFGIGKRRDGQEEREDPSKIRYSHKVYSPGLSNIKLARSISNLHHKGGLNVPTFVQWEIGEALQEIASRIHNVFFKKTLAVKDFD